jgi:hypothetical protein
MTKRSIRIHSRNASDGSRECDAGRFDSLEAEAIGALVWQAFFAASTCHEVRCLAAHPVVRRIGGLVFVCAHIGAMSRTRDGRCACISPLAGSSSGIAKGFIADARLDVGVQGGAGVGLFLGGLW